MPSIFPCLLVGVLMILRAIVLQHKLGGSWWNLPWRFEPAAKYVYFGGIAVVILGNLVARLWLRQLSPDGVRQKDH